MPDPTVDRNLRFVALLRTSTEDQQSPEDSRAWQLARCEQLIAGHGQIIRVAHDIGISRSLPWRRRPEAGVLLDAVMTGRADFDAIVCGELARAFGSPEQTGVLSQLDHFGVGFWTPELSGPHDIDSEAHDLLVSAFCGMSRGERRRVQVRVKAAMTEQARDGSRWMGGRPPFGYALADAGPHPNPSKARSGQRLHRLALDPDAAPTVERIYRMYVDEQLGARTIAQRLTDEGVPSPSAHDPERNPHRQHTGGAWSRGAVAAILQNPVYVGRMTWGRTRGHEKLIDPNTVDLGRQKKSRKLDPSEWIFAAEQTHDPIVSPELFAKAQEERSHGRSRRTDRRPATKRTYLLRGRIWCSSCGRRMQSDTCDGRARYRCRLTTGEYARNDELDRTHPKSAAVSEARLTGAIDSHLARLLDGDDPEATIRAQLGAAAEPDPAITARADRALARIQDADRKLDRYRQALESGTDPATISTWIAEVKAERSAAERELASTTAQTGTSDEQIGSHAAWLTADRGNLVRALAAATPEARTALYEAFGVTLRYTPSSDQVELTIALRPGDCAGVGGGT